MHNTVQYLNNTKFWYCTILYSSFFIVQYASYIMYNIMHNIMYNIMYNISLKYCTYCTYCTYCNRFQLYHILYNIEHNIVMVRFADVRRSPSPSQLERPGPGPSHDIIQCSRGPDSEPCAASARRQSRSLRPGRGPGLGTAAGTAVVTV